MIAKGKVRNLLLKILVVIFFLGLIPITALSDEIMDRIKETGKIRVGFRDDAIPFAYLDPKSGRHIGFSVDMAYLLAENLSNHFGKRIEIQPLAVTPKSRINMTVQGTIDVEMGSTTLTQERENKTDSSLIFFFSETTFLVKNSSGIKTLQDLNNTFVGASSGTTNLNAVQHIVKAGRIKPKGIVITETHKQGMLALKSGRIHAYASDRTLLECMRRNAKNPDKWITVDFAISYEPYVYILREGNSDFRDFLNDTVRWSILTGKFYEIYDKWMGQNGPVPIKMSPSLKDHLNIVTYPMKENWWKE
jgi:ABC-type amino acid transport substrate-binding protein